MWGQVFHIIERSDRRLPPTQAQGLIEVWSIEPGAQSCPELLHPFLDGVPREGPPITVELIIQIRLRCADDLDRIKRVALSLWGLVASGGVDQ